MTTRLRSQNYQATNDFTTSIPMGPSVHGIPVPASLYAFRGSALSSKQAVKRARSWTEHAHRDCTCLIVRQNRIHVLFSGDRSVPARGVKVPYHTVLSGVAVLYRGDTWRKPRGQIARLVIRAMPSPCQSYQLFHGMSSFVDHNHRNDPTITHSKLPPFQQTGGGGRRTAPHP